MRRIKKAQNGNRFSMDEAMAKRDSLANDAAMYRRAHFNRVVEKNWDDIAEELNKRARRSDSLKDVFDKAIEKVTKKTPSSSEKAGQMAGKIGKGALRKGGKVSKGKKAVKAGVKAMKKKAMMVKGASSMPMPAMKKGGKMKKKC